MDSTTIALIARYALTAIGGFLVSKGLATEDQITQLGGALPIIIGVGWGIIAKWQSHAAVINAANTRLAILPTVTSSTKADAP